jgi:hypothetical protein
MPSQDETHAAEPGSSGSRRLSRRSLLQGAATAGAAGLAVTAMGTTQARAATDRPAPGDDDKVKPLPSGPIVLNVRDAKSGDIEVFYGTSQVQLQDKELTARIARAIG